MRRPLRRILLACAMCCAAVPWPAPLGAQDIEITLPGNTESQRFIVKNRAGLPLLAVGANGRVGVATTPSDDATLAVDGRVRIAGGSPGAGKVLTSDASGLASWESPASSGGLTLPYAGSCASGNALDITCSGAAAIIARATNSAGSGANAIAASSSSASAATISACNTNSGQNAPVLGLSDGSSTVFAVNRSGNVVAQGTVSADAFTATSNLGGTAQPGTGTVYQDNVIYAWGVINGSGAIISDFGISSVTRTDNTYNVVFDRPLPNGMAILVTGFGNLFTLNSRTTSSCVVANHGDVASFNILVVGRP